MGNVTKYTCIWNFGVFNIPYIGSYLCMQLIYTLPSSYPEEATTTCRCLPDLPKYALRLGYRSRLNSEIPESESSKVEMCVCAASLQVQIGKHDVRKHI